MEIWNKEIFLKDSPFIIEVINHDLIIVIAKLIKIVISSNYDNESITIEVFTFQ